MSCDGTLGTVSCGATGEVVFVSCCVEEIVAEQLRRAKPTSNSQYSNFAKHASVSFDEFRGLVVPGTPTTFNTVRRVGSGVIVPDNGPGSGDTGTRNGYPIGAVDVY